MQGKTINGFTLQYPLGTGGMAEVWYAENKIGKKAAVKILLPKLCLDENVVMRFLTEAKVMVKLNHPNIRQVYDYGDIDGRPAIVMEYLEGNDLKAWMKQGQRFTDEELIRWWNQLVDVLNYTHQKGIVHRDIKPGNIFIDNECNIKLLDFGIAKIRESISSTQTGQKLGTLMYMSPEQVKDSKHIDYHTDAYSLAVTFVHLISGKKPYDSDTSSDFEISEQIVYKPLDLSEIPAVWRSFLTPYLNKEPEKRPELKPFSVTKKRTTAKTAKQDDEGTIVDEVKPKKDEEVPPGVDPETGEIIDEGTIVDEVKPHKDEEVPPGVDPETGEMIEGWEKEKPRRKKKWLWFFIAGIAIYFVIVWICDMQRHSEAYEQRFLARTYKIDIPVEFVEYAHAGRHIYYKDNQGAFISVYGGHCYFAGTSSALDLLNLDTHENNLVINKNLFIKTTIGFQQAMYAKEDVNPTSYQEAVIYSENTGGYYIHCEYPTNKKSYYEAMMENVIYSFKDKF